VAGFTAYIPDVYEEDEIQEILGTFDTMVDSVETE
jgi:hypothetical protein